MNISDRISEIKEYFKEMQVKTVDGTHQILYVIVDFPNGWIVDSSVEQKYNVTILKQNGLFVFCCDIEDGEETVFDAISYCITKMKDTIARANLLKEKTIELKELFSDESIPVETLKDLKFVYGQVDSFYVPSFTTTDNNVSIAENYSASSYSITTEEVTNKKKEEKKVNE